MLKNLSQFWQSLLLKSSQSAPAPKFVDLAPTANADNAGIYFEALNYATNNDDVLNIAVTGPYGSGKSSVIKSFLARYPGAPLQLSLASFLPDGETPGIRVSKQEIERSILQQILYGVEADKLPFSRFKRIQTPKPSSIVTALFIVLGLTCAWYLFSKQADILSGSFFKPFELSHWFNYSCVAVVAAFSWKVIHSVYTTSLGLSLKSISLKDVQIAPAAANEESILNRHLDEILYFFQSTKYDLVVIEDLDRFENPDIFVTLREINGLINANEGIRRRVRFLYALRDDIFANTDRTKFFEFIVPIIPVINHSNSIDKVVEQGQRIDLDTKLNRQFIREVSRYLTDLRLIRNIFNEYVVYAANLKADSEGPLDPNKLLAILIYKNVIPKDFAALHQQEGALSKVLGRYDQYISKIEREIHDELSVIEADLATGEAVALRDQSDLRRVYAMAIVERVPPNYTNIQIPNVNVQLSELAASDALEQVIARKSMTIVSPFAGKTNIDLSDLEEKVDQTQSFEQRKAEVNRKSSAHIRKFEDRLRELKSQLATLRTRKFNEVIRENADLIDEVFAEVGGSRDLLKYLILEGYLDDTYYQYISLFHSGRLSPNDNNFLIRIRGYSNPPPDFQIDNAAEVIASMRAEDFGQHYVLNRFIFDRLLSDKEVNSQRLANATHFIATHFEVCGEFFRSYYAKGAQVENLTKTLTESWPGFAAVALGGTDGASHAARILAYTPDPLLTKVSTASALKSFLSENTRQVLAEGVDFDIARLRSLGVEIDDTRSLTEFPSALLFVAQEGLYRISVENFRHVFGQVVGLQKVGDLEKRHFSTVREANNAALLRRIDADFPAYLNDVLLVLETDTDEDVSAISAVLAQEDVEHEKRAKFLERQTAVFPNFADIPAAFYPVVLEGQKIEATWENCLGFLTSDAYDAEELTEYLEGDKTAAALSRQQIPGDEPSLPLRQFIIGNDDLNAEVYRSYVRQLPKSFDEAPEVDTSKIQILIEERKLTFTSATFDNLPDADLQVLFVAMNFAAYEAEQNQYSIDDGFRAKLLRTRITDAQKLKLIGEIDESYVASNPSVSADIGPLLDRAPIGQHDYGVDFIRAVILNSRAIKVQISLLNKLNASLSVSQVREILRGLPGSFKDIATFGRSPKIESSDINRQLVVWLKERNIISSFADTLLGDELRIHTFKKEP